MESRQQNPSTETLNFVLTQEVAALLVQKKKKWKTQIPLFKKIKTTYLQQISLASHIIGQFL